MTTLSASEIESPPSPLAIPIFRAVWLSSLVSNFGGLIQAVGAAWMMVSLGGTEQQVALVQSSLALPIMLLALWAGAVADNFDRRLVMLAAQLFMFAVSIALALCAWFGVLTPWMLLAFTFAIGCGTAVNSPAWQAAVGDMVPRAVLPNAVTLNSMNYNIARSLGPAIGGAIVAAWGAAAAFTVNAFTYTGLIGVLLRWRPEQTMRHLPRERLDVAMAAGIRYVLMSPNIRVVLFRAIFFSFAAAGIPAMMPLVARDLVGGDALVFGALLGAFGVGAVCAALANSRLRQRLTVERIVMLATLAGALGAALAGASRWIPLTLVALFLGGGAWVLALSSFNVIVQMAAPRWVVARALALYQMVAFGALALGSWTLGLVAEHQGVAIALFATAAIQALGALVALGFPLPAVEQMNLDPAGGWTEPETAVPVEPRSGPVVVMIEYRIAPANIRPFLAAMAERRRIRRRDGARGWSLLRDLGDPMLWIERYHVATWLDYVRHNHRRTQADTDNSHAIHALQEGPLRIHRMLERQTGSLPGTRAPDPREMADARTDPAQST